MPVVAGVDSSTSATKVEVRDLDTGALVATGRAPHPPTFPPRSEQHPADWWSAFTAAADQAGLGTTHHSVALAVAAQQHGLVALDAAGRVLRPAKLWNDTESATEARDLVAALGAGAWAAAVGSVPLPAFTITKLAWLRRHEPAAFGRIAHLLLPHDWLTYRLTGRFTTDRGDASGTGWWSPVEGRYRTGLLDLVDPGPDWEGMLPDVLPPLGTAGTWRGAVVGPGTGDNMAAALGLGMRPGDLALSFGTSGTAFTVSEAPSADATGAVAGFADATGRFLPLVCTLNAMKVTDAVARLLGVTPADLDALALAAPVGAGGPVLVPHLDGERTPNLPGAAGSLVGIRSDVTREQLARAAVEGVVCNLLAGADHLPPASGRVFVVGGGARSRAVPQVVADLLGRPVHVPGNGELVALGAAVQAAAVAAGSSPGQVAAAWHLGASATVDPDPRVNRQAVRARYAEAAGRAATGPAGA